MPTKLSTKAVEGSTFIVKADFYETTDVGQNPVVPNAGLNWSLCDEDGVIVNARTDVPIASASSVNIVLSGNDLALGGNHPVRRYLTIKGTYNGVSGNNLPIVDEVSFQISNLRGEP